MKNLYLFFSEVITVFIMTLVSTAFLVDTALADNSGYFRLFSIADAYVDKASQNVNRGGSHDLFFGPAPEFGYPRKIFIEFDDISLPGDAIIGSAELIIYQHTSSGDPQQGTNIYSVSSAWNESEITWDNMPLATLQSSVDVSVEDGLKRIDITDLVRGLFNGTIPNHGLMISAAGEEGPQLFSRGFYSRESPRCAPYIEVTYTTSVVPPEPATAPPCGPLTDTTPPELTITVSPDPPVAGSYTAVFAEAEDDIGMYRVQLMRGGIVVADESDESVPLRLTASEGVTLEPGVYTYSAFAWDRDMNGITKSKLVRVLHDGEPPSIIVSHTPHNPAVGELVTFTAIAEDDSQVNHLTISLNGILHDFRIDPPNTRVEQTIRFDEETLGYDPSDIRVIRYYASATDREGFYTSTGTKYVLFGNTGPDTDSDQLSDEIEEILGLDQNNNDTDEDGLYDGWEVIGLDRGLDGTIDLDLPMLGANPYLKDLFVEVDWMQDETHNLKPHPTAVQALVNTFRNHGIRIHVDTGGLGGGNAVDFEANTCEYEKSWLEETKISNFDPNRRGIFYYIGAMSPDDDCGSKYIGAGNIILRSRAIHGYAVNMMHELGHGLGIHHGGQKELSDPRSVPTLGPNGDIITDDQVFWEEDDENYKPNYLSIMNYQYQWQLRICVMPGDDEPCVCTGHLDEGERALVENPCNDVFPMTFNLHDHELDEAFLHESEGFEAPANIGTYVWRQVVDGDVQIELHRPTLQGWYYIERYDTSGCCTEDCRPNPKDTVLSLADGSPIDWNFNGVIDAGIVEYDLNKYWSGTREVCHNIIDRHLSAPYEIPQLQTKIWGNINYGVSVDDLSPVDPPEPITPTDGEVADGNDNDSDGQVDEGFSDTDADGIAEPIDNCPQTGNSNQFDTNLSYIGDACKGSPDAPTALSIGIVDGKFELRWTPSIKVNILGYNVYRKMRDEDDFRRLGVSFPTAFNDTSYVDKDCIDGTTYAVSAVNVYMNESGMSEGVVLADSDGDDICDKIEFRHPNPYSDARDDPEKFMPYWFIILLILLIIIGWLVFRRLISVSST